MENTPPIVNIAGYRFTPLPDFAERRAAYRERCLALGLKGTILLSPEGINVMLAGEAEAVEAIKTHLRAEPGLADLEFKQSLSRAQPFDRLLVKLKKEIISFGVAQIDPARSTGPALPAAEFKRWLDEGRDITILDTRNDYEVRLGTFKGAKHLDIQSFRDFPAAVRQLDATLKGKPLVMFCTGGVRCEKASPYLLDQGFKEVYQLEGGILKYFEECGGAHWEGECFVFDQRVGLDARLEATGALICEACQEAVTAEQQQTPDFIPAVCCPHCATRNKPQSHADAHG